LATEIPKTTFSKSRPQGRLPKIDLKFECSKPAVDLRFKGTPLVSDPLLLGRKSRLVEGENKKNCTKGQAEIISF
jgi:hypothetical protein